MSRQAGASIPKYRKHRASGQAVVTIAGSDHYLGPHGTKASRIEYDRRIAEWMVAGKPTSISTTTDLTVAELIKAYKKYAESYYQHGGMIHNIGTACRTLRLIYGNTPASEFGPLRLKAVREKLVENGSSRTYCNRLTDLLRRMFKWAASEELIAVEVYHALATVAGLRQGHTDAHENEPIRPVADEIVEATLPKLSPTVADMVRLQRLTGMRPAEVCRLTPEAIDRTCSPWRFTLAEHKTAHHGRQRIVFIGPKAQEILLPYLLRDAQAFCFVPTESEAKRLADLHAKRKTPIQYGNSPGTKKRRKPRRKPGNHYDVNAYRRAIHRACDRAFPPAQELTDDEKQAWLSAHRWSPNQLRHAAATEIRKRFDIEAAQVVLGHAKPDMTLTYAERDLSKAAAIMQQVG